VEQTRITQILLNRVSCPGRNDDRRLRAVRDDCLRILAVKIRELLAFYPEPYPWGKNRTVLTDNAFSSKLVIDMVLYVFAQFRWSPLPQSPAGRFREEGSAGLGQSPRLPGPQSPSTFGRRSARTRIVPGWRWCFLIPVATSIVSCAGFIHALLRNPATKEPKRSRVNR